MILTGAILVAGFFGWIADLSSDPPMYYSGLGQSLATDPFHLVFHARNEALFGESDPFDYPRWTVYEHSLVSMVGRICFSMIGVSRVNANLVGVVLSFAGLLFLLLAVFRYHSRWVGAAVTLVFVGNITLLTHGRLPYLETAIIFWASLVMFVFSRWGHRAWGAALSGVLVSFAMLTGKLFGAVLLGPVVLSLLFSDVRSRYTNAICSVAGFLIGSAGLVAILYGENFSSARAYIMEQSHGLYGTPEGLTSPWAFVESIISYGFTNRLYNLDPDLGLMLMAGGFMIVMLGLKSIRTLSPVTRFALFWIVCATIGLAPLNYSPIRYTLLLIPAIIVFGFTILDRDDDKLKRRHLGWGEFAVLVFVSWFGLYHLIGNSFYYFPVPGRWLIWATLPGAIGLALLVRFLAGRGKFTLGRRSIVTIAIVLVSVSVVNNGIRYWEFHIYDRAFQIKEANEDLAQILGPGAVVSGSYGTTLTFNTKVKSFIHLFGVATVDSTLFDRQPITHLAVDVDNYVEAVAAYRDLELIPPTASYYVCNYKVRILDISQRFANRVANAYVQSDYERAMQLFHQGQYDSAYVLADRFFRKHPDSKSIRLLMADLLMVQGRNSDVLQLMIRTADMFPTDFYVQAQCGRLIQQIGLRQNDPSMSARADRYYERAVAANHTRGEFVDDLRRDVIEQHGKR